MGRTIVRPVEHERPRPSSPGVSRIAVVPRADLGSNALAMRLLGGLEVSEYGNVVLDESWPRRRALAVIKILALQPRRSLHREQLADMLWPSAALPTALLNLRQNLFLIRSLLHRRGVETELISQCGERLSIAPNVRIDVEEFVAAAGQVGEDESLADAALSLYTGDLLEHDLYSSWTEPQRGWLQATRDRMLLVAARYHYSIGAFDRAAMRYRQVLAANPDHQQAFDGLMRCEELLDLGSFGRTGGSVRLYSE